MNRYTNTRGFTLYELLIIVFFIFLVYFVPYLAILEGNYWFNDAGAFRELQANSPEVAKLLTTERGIYNKSRITVETKEGTRAVFCLDTNIFFNYSFSKCS